MCLRVNFYHALLYRATVKELLCCVTPVITVRNSSCGKVMFLKVSVCPQGGVHPPGTPPRRPLQRTVRIPLECILVKYKKFIKSLGKGAVPFLFHNGYHQYKKNFLQRGNYVVGRRIYKFSLPMTACQCTQLISPKG